MSGHIFMTPEQLTELKTEDATVVVIDADIPCYSVGFTCERETSWYMVQKTVDNFMSKVVRESQATHLIGFLTDGAANFRNEDATTFKYKGNRVSAKPKWYDKIREHLIKNWYCQIMVGIEADDALAIAQEYFLSNGIKCVMATLDKDLDQVVGWKYNWKGKGLYYVDEAAAHRALWKQVITGDLGTDNIPGLSHSAWKIHGDTMVPVFESEMRIPSEPKILKSGEPSQRKMAHARQVGWVKVEAKDQRPLAEDLYGDVTAYELLDSWAPEEYPERVLNEYVGAYWEEAIIQEYDDPAELGIKRYEEVFALVYMLRTVEEIPNEATISFVPHRAELQVLAEFDDEEFDPLSDFDDDEF